MFINYAVLLATIIGGIIHARVECKPSAVHIVRVNESMPQGSRIKMPDIVSTDGPLDEILFVSTKSAACKQFTFGVSDSVCYNWKSQIIECTYELIVNVAASRLDYEREELRECHFKVVSKWLRYDVEIRTLLENEVSEFGFYNELISLI